MKVLKNASLREFNTFGLNETCKELVIIEHEADISELCRKYAEDIRRSSYAVLGGGSDVLILHSLDYPVFCMRLKGIQIDRVIEDICYVTVAAGEIWDTFVRAMIDQGLYGLENLCADSRYGRRSSNTKYRRLWC